MPRRGRQRAFAVDVAVTENSWGCPRRAVTAVALMWAGRMSIKVQKCPHIQKGRPPLKWLKRTGLRRRSFTWKRMWSQASLMRHQLLGPFPSCWNSVDCKTPTWGSSRANLPAQHPDAQLSYKALMNSHHFSAQQLRKGNSTSQLILVRFFSREPIGCVYM